MDHEYFEGTAEERLRARPGEKQMTEVDEKILALDGVTHKPVARYMERHVGDHDRTLARYTYVVCSCGVELVVKATSVVDGYDVDEDKADARAHFSYAQSLSSVPWDDSKTCVVWYSEVAGRTVRTKADVYGSERSKSNGIDRKRPEPQPQPQKEA